jgi:hypothetical protein
MTNREIKNAVRDWRRQQGIDAKRRPGQLRWWATDWPDHCAANDCNEPVTPAVTFNIGALLTALAPKFKQGLSKISRLGSQAQRRIDHRHQGRSNAVPDREAFL